MSEVSTIGLDIAKSVFQVHGTDVDGTVVIRKRIRRAKLLEFFASLPACLVGIEACPTAHYWSRRLEALGHTVRLLPKRCQRRCRNLRGGHPAVDAICGDEV
jgi:transposase